MLLITLAMSALTLAMNNDSSADRSNINLTLEGDAGTRIGGYCDVVTEATTERHPLTGGLPQRHSWQGQAASCEIEQMSGSGSTTATLEKDGNRSRLRTSGAGSRIRLKMT